MMDTSALVRRGSRSGVTGLSSSRISGSGPSKGKRATTCLPVLRHLPYGYFGVNVVQVTYFLFGFADNEL